MSLHIFDAWARGYSIGHTAKYTEYTVGDVRRAFDEYDKKYAEKKKRAEKEKK